METVQISQPHLICSNKVKEKVALLSNVSKTFSLLLRPYKLDVDPAIMGVFNGFKDHENNKVVLKRRKKLFK